MFEITPKDVLRILQDTETAFDISNCHDAVFACEDMPVFRIHDGIVHQACTRSIHGVHRRYRQAANALEAMVGKVEQDKCPDCDGTGWLPADSPGAARNRILSIVCGVFRGIKLPVDQERLTGDDLVATLGGQFGRSFPL